ncbi:four helix bundle protein [Roseivirga sp. 4D4]|uniref:four helix bundle protein n=1 Tax=Roseivirga sp. 4D4 TaxID=1889784 RepID=UPI000853B37A|nr:four helix bundle protein [Roseivirga sp. 4D4]OEK01530.1 four helix bundle protein [Roseivirga sp. 4D4]
MEFSGNPIEKKSFEFSLMIIEKYKEMQAQKEFILSKQLLRSGTSIGANVQEAQAAISKRDFAHKMSISSKEARETKYWLLLSQYGGLVELDLESILEKNEELIRMLTAIVKSSQKALSKHS